MKTLPLILALAAFSPCAFAQHSRIWNEMEADSRAFRVETQQIIDQQQRRKDNRAIMDKLDAISSSSTSAGHLSGYTVPLAAYQDLAEKYETLLATVKALRKENDDLKFQLKYFAPR